MQDWDMEYDGSRFAWLGDGRSQTEVDEGANLAWYVRERMMMGL